MREEPKQAREAVESALAYIEATHDSDPHGIQAGLELAAETLRSIMGREARRVDREIGDILDTYFQEKVLEFKATELGTELHKSEAVLELCDRMDLEERKADLVEFARRELADILGTPGEVETVQGCSSWMLALAKPKEDARSKKWESLLEGGE